MSKSILESIIDTKQYIIINEETGERIETNEIKKEYKEIRKGKIYETYNIAKCIGIISKGKTYINEKWG